jgi:hypothetical protein
MSAVYTHRIDAARRVFLHVEFMTDRRTVIDYAVVLLVRIDGQMETVRVYDGAHGENDLHRYGRRGGKMPAEVFHRGTLGEGMRAAIQDARRSYVGMIESWNKR